MTLKERLEDYRDSGMYPMHMPGHKRQCELLSGMYGIDITEIDGFDNLHHAQGILREAMERAARMAGARRTWFLVNGSTCGLLAGIYATTKPGDTVLVARNCHKSVYHGLALRNAKPVYLYPKRHALGYAEAISAEAVAEAIAEHQPRLVVITSPTYEGVCSDIGRIAAICREAGVLLLVDEAHGAHLPYMYDGGEMHFPADALSQGADVVVQSVHKTLPAPTQAALLHLGSGRVDEEAVSQALAIFETSSPSYPLLAGIDACFAWLAAEGEAAARHYSKRLGALYHEAAALRRVSIVSADGRDPGKVLITAKCLMTGREIYDILKDRFGIQPEMATRTYCLLMTSLCDTEEGFARVSDALRTLDRELDECDGQRERQSSGCNTVSMECNGRLDQPHAIAVCSVTEALSGTRRQIPIEALTGDEIAAEWVGPYPPGIPLICPGERVREVLPALRREAQEGTIGEQLWVSCIL